MNDLRIPIQSYDPRLKRNINHDPRSLAYAVDTAGLEIVDKEWKTASPILDQGDMTFYVPLSQPAPTPTPTPTPQPSAVDAALVAAGNAWRRASSRSSPRPGS